MIYPNIFQSFFIISFATGIFPEKLKVVKVILTHKKNFKLEWSNYRPISLLSNIDKILEKLMHNRLMKLLTEQKILYLKQFGFRKNFSIAHAIIYFIDGIENAIDQERLSVGFSLTFTQHLVAFWNKWNFFFLIGIHSMQG